MPQSNTYNELAVGLNALSMMRILRNEAAAEGVDQLSLHDAGVRHWPILAAMQGGTLTLTTSTTTDKEGRTYTERPYTLQSLPRKSGLRAAITSPKPGEVLISADWRASHWQILAFRSGDIQLQEDLRSGDLYSTLFPGYERKKVKAGLATLLNGGGVPAMTKFFGEQDAQKFYDEAKQLFKTRWATANAYRKQIAKQAIDEGHASAEKQYTGAGVALMRLEAQALEVALETLCTMGLGASVVLPLHDGALVSAPKEKAEEAAEQLRQLMALCSTLSEDEAQKNANTWVDVSISNSWSANEPQLLGHDLRAAALAGVTSTDEDAVALAAAVMPAAVEARLRSVAANSTEARLLRGALARRRDAITWLNTAEDRNEHPRVELTQRQGSYSVICRILRQDLALPRVRFNLRTLDAEVQGTKVDDARLGPLFVEPIENRYGIQADFTLVGRAVHDVARENSYDPILDYFEGLLWDGCKRLDTWLHDLTGAVAGASTEPVRMANVYGRKWLMSIVARAYRPGCKADAILVLQGQQNIGKSTLFRAIAPCGSFSAVVLNPADKDIVRRAASFAVVEWPEAAGMSKRDQEALKNYFSEQIDRLRLPYGKADVEILRRVIFGMTANGNSFLQDPTGSRRYWPITVGTIDLEQLAEVKDQLYAEAVHIYKQNPDLGYLWWLTPEEEALREEGAADYTAEDPFVDAVLAVSSRNHHVFSTRELLSFLDVPAPQQRKISLDLANTCRTLGYVSKIQRVGEDRVPCRVWCRKDNTEV